MEDEFWIQEDIARALLSENYDVFKHYLIDLSSEKHPDPQADIQARRIFSTYGYPDDFDAFVETFQTLCREKKEKRCESVQTEPVQALREVETEDYPLYRDWQHRVSVVPPFRKRRRVETGFNAVDFLLQKRKHEETFSLKLHSDDDVQETLSGLQTTEKKKSNLLGEGVLRKVAQLVELLNRTCDYRILEVDYDNP